MPECEFFNTTQPLLRTTDLAASPAMQPFLRISALQVGGEWVAQDPVLPAVEHNIDDKWMDLNDPLVDNEVMELTPSSGPELLLPTTTGIGGVARDYIFV